MRYLCLIAILSAAQAFAADQPGNDRKHTPRYSREQLDRIRQSFMAQIAVRDDAENAMRAPTPQEAAALSGSPQSSTAAPVPLRNGGLALKSDASQLSLAVASVDAHGRTTISHRPAKATAKGKANAR